jgi:hypothetical protein
LVGGDAVEVAHARGRLRLYRERARRAHQDVPDGCVSARQLVWL